MVLFLSLQQAKEAWQMDYSATAHSATRIREMLAATCRDRGWKPVDGAYKIRRFIAERYLKSYFRNLSLGDIKVLLSNMIFEGIVFPEYDKLGNYICIPFDRKK